MRIATYLITSAALTILSTNLHAGMISIEPDDFIEGSVVNGMDGTTLSYVANGVSGGPLTLGPIYATKDFYDSGASPVTPTGSLVMGALVPYQQAPHTRFTHNVFAFIHQQETTALSLGNLHLYSDFAALKIDFAETVDYFSATMMSASGDWVRAFAFDASGNFLADVVTGYLPRGESPACAGYLIACFQYEITLERGAGDIATILLGSSSASAGIDAIRYRVPEPGTLGLISGMLMMCMAARRRQQASAATIHQGAHFE